MDGRCRPPERGYETDRLAQLTHRLRDALEPAPHEAMAFEAALDSQLPRYLRHLHGGRVAPSTLGFRVGSPRDEPNYEALVSQAVAQMRFAQTAADLAPALPAYQQLRDALARYRALAAEDSLPSWTPPMQADARPRRRTGG